ncbi:hypothetical protein Gotur_031807, partial [Gossypium turneri]
MRLLIVNKIVDISQCMKRLLTI